MSTRDVYGALWRHKVFILAATAGLVLVTWYLTSLVTPTYKAAALVRIQQLEDGDPASGVYALQASERLAETYAEIVDSGALNRRLQASLADTLPAEAAREARVTGDPVEGVDLLWMIAKSHDPEVARAVADAAPAALSALVADSGTVGDRVVTVKPALLPTEPTSPDLALNLVIAVVVGLLLNGALALAAEALRDRVVDPRRASETFGLPVLARVPTLTLVRPEPPEGGGDARPSPGGGEETPAAIFAGPRAPR